MQKEKIPLLKPCSPMLAGLFIIALLVHYPTHGWGSAAALFLAVSVMGGQLFLRHQVEGDFARLEEAKAQYLQHGDPALLQQIDLTALRLLHENKLLTDHARARLQALRAFSGQSRRPIPPPSDKETSDE